VGTWKKLGYEDDVITKALLTEQGDIIYASAASTPAALAHGTATQYLKSGGNAANPSWDTPAGGGPTIVRKTADETVNNSAVLQNDDHLFMPVAANEIWEIFLNLYISYGKAPDFKYTLVVPAGATCPFYDHQDIAQDGVSVIEAIKPTAAATAKVILNTSAAGGDAIEVRFVEVRGVYVGGGNAGNIQLQWAQNTATVQDTKVLANSYIKAFKLG
jgi:hypothetical protein